jgi:hypothetical protein
VGEGFRSIKEVGKVQVRDIFAVSSIFLHVL